MTRAAYEVARTISEGMPDNGEHGPGPEIPRGAPKGASPSLGTQDASRRLSLLSLWNRSRTALARGAQWTQGGRYGFAIERGDCAPVMARRDGCLASIRAPPALRPPLIGGGEW